MRNEVIELLIEDLEGRTRKREKGWSTKTGTEWNDVLTQVRSSSSNVDDGKGEEEISGLEAMTALNSTITMTDGG